MQAEGQQEIQEMDKDEDNGKHSVRIELAKMPPAFVYGMKFVENEQRLLNLEVEQYYMTIQGKSQEHREHLNKTDDESKMDEDNAKQINADGLVLTFSDTLSQDGFPAAKNDTQAPKPQLDTIIEIDENQEPSESEQNQSQSSQTDDVEIDLNEPL